MSDDTTWFWEIVDANGLNNVSSDERQALRELVAQAARAETATRQRDEALAALKASEERGERLSQELASARLRPELSSVESVAAVTAKEQLLGRLEHYAKSKNALGYYGPGDSFIDQGTVTAIIGLLDALSSQPLSLSEARADLAASRKLVERREAERDREKERADENWDAYRDAIRERDDEAARGAVADDGGGLSQAEERASLAERQLDAISAAIGSARFMNPPDGGDVSLADQVRRMRAELEVKERHLAALENGPASLAGATNNPPSDPGTEQREAGR